MISIFLFSILCAEERSQKIEPEDILLKIAQKRSKFSAKPKITIEEAYLSLGHRCALISKKNLASKTKRLDEIACFKFHKQLFRGDKIIATIGRHAGRIYDQTQEKKGRNILLSWKKLASNQLSAPYPYTYKGRHKISQIYDFGEDDAGYFHICVIKRTKDSALPVVNIKKVSPIKKELPIPPKNSLIGQMIEKDKAEKEKITKEKK